MNSLLLFYDNSGDKYYIPTNNIQRVYRVDTDTVRIVTNVFAHDDNTHSKYLCYDVEDATALGVADTTQSQSIIDAWGKALASSSSIITVELASPILGIVTCQETWI